MISRSAIEKGTKLGDFPGFYGINPRNMGRLSDHHPGFRVENDQIFAPSSRNHGPPIISPGFFPRNYPLVMTNIANWKMVHLWMIYRYLPIKNGDFPWRHVK